MAGPAAAGPLNAAVRIGPARDADRFAYRLARPADDAGVRRLLRENPFEGAIRLSLECEPNAMAAAVIYGRVHQMLVAEDRRTGAIVATACRAERDLFVNGRAQRLGYLGQLRVDARVRRQRRLLADGFAFCRTLHDDARVPAYLVSIVEDNWPARRLLSSGRIPNQPAFTPLEPLVTFALPAARGIFSGAPLLARGGIERGRAELRVEIGECLQRYGARHQMSPVWTAGDLASPAYTPGLSVDDFLVMRRGGRVTACAACWDQRAIKQAVVRGYSPAFTRGRILMNLAGPLTGAPYLPRVGSPLSFAFLSHLAADEEHADGFVHLVDAALATARQKGVQYLVLGLAARHPLAAVIARRFRHRRYVSQLYLAHWPDGDGFVRWLDGRVPHPEVAVL